MEFLDYTIGTQLLFLFFAGTFGAVAGSFFNMLIFRLPRDMDILLERSHCVKCKHPLGPMDLIPVLSYFIQLGKCRYCGVDISVRYLLVEVITMILFPILLVINDVTWVYLASLVLASCLIVVFFTDIETKIIPDEISFFMIVAGIVLSEITTNFFYSIQGALLGGGVIFLIGYAGKMLYGKDVMGGGDVKLFAGVGAFLGLRFTIVALYFSFLLGGIIGLLLLLLGVKRRDEMIAFGPSIVLGTLLASVFGSYVLEWYFSLNLFS